MRLSVHLIANGKAYLAGTEIPEEEISEFATRYVDEAPVNREVSRSQTDDSMKRRRHSPKKDTYVKRGNAYVPLSRIDGYSCATVIVTIRLHEILTIFASAVVGNWRCKSRFRCFWRFRLHEIRLTSVSKTRLNFVSPNELIGITG
jgi:hypothetical protein